MMLARGGSCRAGTRRLIPMHDRLTDWLRGFDLDDFLHAHVAGVMVDLPEHVRDDFVGDPAFVDVPVAGLIDPAYIRQRAALVGQRSMGRALPGVPPGVRVARVAAIDVERPSTSHISVVDRFGNALSMTTTIEDGFGSRQMVHGFMLNNQLTDFSLAPSTAEGVPVANRVQPGKRPRSSMTPTRSRR